MSAHAPRTRIEPALIPALSLTLALLSGCAALLPPVTPAAAGASPPPPAASRAVTTGTSVTPPPARAVVVDSLPSSDAQSVLATIAEPIPAAARVSAPPSAAAPPPAAVPSDTTTLAAPADRDTAAVAAGSDSASAEPDTSRDSARAEVPVPTETRPLGDRPGAIERMLQPDTTRTAAPAAPSAPAASQSAAPAPPDSCFRIQIAARGAKSQATSLRDVAASQLLVPMVIELDHGLYKVRSRDCLNRAGADALKARATASGFSGVFRFVGAAP